jgi:hypothetical protein
LLPSIIFSRQTPLHIHHSYILFSIFQFFIPLS